MPVLRKRNLKPTALLLVVFAARASQTRKPYTITRQRERWTEDEHDRFVEALRLHGRQWRKIEGERVCLLLGCAFCRCRCQCTHAPDTFPCPAGVCCRPCQDENHGSDQVTMCTLVICLVKVDLLKQTEGAVAALREAGNPALLCAAPHHSTALASPACQPCR